VATESTILKGKVLKVEHHDLVAVAAVLKAAKVVLVQTTPFARDAFLGQAENLQCLNKLADNTQAAVVARELRERQKDLINVDFIRLCPVLRSTLRHLAVGLSQSFDSALAELFTRHTVIDDAVNVFRLANRRRTVGNTV
jgi:hypothetical protein